MRLCKICELIHSKRVQEGLIILAHDVQHVLVPNLLPCLGKHSTTSPRSHHRTARAFLLGIILVLDDPTCLGLCGPTDVEVFVFGDCTVLLRRTRLLLGLPSWRGFTCFPCTVSVHSVILLRPLESFLGVTVYGVDHVMCLVVTSGDTCVLLWMSSLVALAQSCVRPWRHSSRLCLASLSCIATGAVSARGKPGVLLASASG